MLNCLSTILNQECKRTSFLFLEVCGIRSRNWLITPISPYPSLSSSSKANTYIDGVGSIPKSHSTPKQSSNMDTNALIREARAKE